jgi:hypothetical protein
MANRALCLIGEIIFARSSEDISGTGQGFGIPLKQYDIFINGKCIGVTGARDQTIQVYTMDIADFKNSHTVINTIQLEQCISDAAIEEFVKDWLSKNPEYTLVDVNSQKFAKDFVKHFWNIDVLTQTNQYGFIGLLLGLG